MIILFKLIFSALFTLYTVKWIYLKILKIAKIKDIVDNPNVRKLQKTPMPVLGGLAVFFGLLMGLLLFSALNFGKNSISSPLIIGAGILLFFGAMDDILNLTPKSRFIIEIVVLLGMVFGSGMCIDSLYGLWGIYDFSWWIAVPLTIFAGVGIINAYNMIDGVNGLSSGICICCSFFYAIFFLNRFDYSDCALSVCFGSALIPFFLHNVFGNRSRMFIGDSGTMVMGLFVTWYSIQFLSSSNHGYLISDSMLTPTVGVVAFVLSIAAVPVADALRVMIFRMINGKSPFVGDKTHLHHIFIKLGFSHFFTTISEILINVIIILIWYASYKLGASIDMQLYITILASIVFVWGTYLFISLHSRKNSKFYDVLNKLSSCTHFGHKKWWLRYQRYLDRHAFEDYRLIIVNRYNKSLDELTKIECFESSIVNYLQGRNSLKLSELRDEGLIEDEYFDIVIESLVKKNILQCTQTDKNGEIVKIGIGSIL